MNKIPFSPPDITQAEIDMVVEVLKSGWITTGPKTKLFEQKIAQRCNTNKAVCLSSQTACAEMTLRILGIGEGDEVIVPAYTYTASASVICHVGATPVMVDCAKNRYQMDYDKLEEAITEKTKAVIAVDLAGVVCNYGKIFEAVERKKHLFKPESEMQKKFGRVVVISDAAHAFGAQRDGKMCGEIADFTCFSFHAVKNLTTAEGGAATWRPIDGVDDEELYREYMLMSLHGQTKDAMAKNKGTQWEYDVVDTQYKCNMPDVLAAIGLAQLERYDSILERRHSLIEKYEKAFADLPIKTLTHTGETFKSSGHLYIMRFVGKDEEYRNKFFKRMIQKGVTCNVHFKPLPLLTAYKSRGYNIEDYPNAYEMFRSVITLPMNSVMTDEEVDYVIKSVRECI